MWGDSLNTKLADKDLLILCLVCSSSEILSECPKCCTRHNMQGLARRLGVVLQPGVAESNGQQNKYFECEKDKKKFFCSTDSKLLS
jgi:hypothetical protein